MTNNETKQRMKSLLKFSSPKEPSPHKNTEEYKAGVEDAIKRIEYLSYCYKYGPGDEEDFLVMDTLTEAQAIVELLLEE